MDAVNTISEQYQTSFDPAGRDDVGKLLEQRNSFLTNGLADALLQSMPDFAMLINSRRQIVAVNGNMLRITGVHDSTDLLGRRPGEALNCIHAEESPGGCGTGHNCSVCGAVLAIVESQQSGVQAVRECHVTLKGDDETVLEMRATATPIMIQDEKFTAFVLQDISNDKRRELLERVFFHDIITTAGSILGVASILAEQDGLNTSHETEYKNWLVRLSGALVDEIRSQKKLLAAEHGEFVPELSPVGIRSILADLFRIYQHYETTPGRSLVIADEPDFILITDASVMRRILGNMILNALEATPAGGVVTVSARLEESNVVVDVHNAGVIPEDIQLQIFKRSFSTKAQTGRGIGTYSMKLFGERYLKGRVSFRSNCNEGTLFSFSLPAA